MNIYRLTGRFGHNIRGKIKPHQHVVVALSGGKDSGALLILLKRIKMPLKISAVFFHEGTLYRERSLGVARQMAQDMDVPLYVVKWPLKWPLHAFRRPCSICSLVKRRYLNEAALYLNGDWLAVGHTAEDIAEAFLLNVIRNEPERIFRSPLFQTKLDERLVPRMKPIYNFTAEETTWIMKKYGYEVLPKACPYMHTSARFKVRKVLEGLKSYSANIAKSYAYYSGLKSQSPIKLSSCKWCGAPSSGPICSLCRLLHVELGDAYEPPGEVSRFMHKEV